MKKLTVKQILKFGGITLGGLLATAVALISAMYGTFYFVSFLSHGFYKIKSDVRPIGGYQDVLRSTDKWSYGRYADEYFAENENS